MSMCGHNVVEVADASLNSYGIDIAGGGFFNENCGEFREL